MANLLSTIVTGSLSVNVDSSGSSISTVNNGNSSRWYGRITTFNSTSDKSVFLGTYASVAVVGAHNNALTAWANLYVNNVDGVNGGNVYLPTNSYVANNSIIHSGGGQTIGGITYFSNGESMQVYGIRGRFTNEYIHLYEKVGIGHPGGWGQGQANTPSQGLSTYGGANFAYGNNATSSFNGHLRIDRNWGLGDYGAEQFTIRGTYPSITLRSTQHNSKWLIHNDDTLSFYYGGTVDDNSWGRKLFIPTDGNIWMSWAGDYISNLLGAKQNASTAITTSNIGSQSVSYAANAGNLGGLSSSRYPKQDYYSDSSYNWNTIEAADTTAAIVLRIESAVQNPPANDVYNWSLWQQGTRSRGSQIAVAAYGEERIYFRGSNFDTGSYHNWNEIIHSGNIGSQSVGYASSAGNSATTSQIVFSDLKTNFPSGAGGGHSFASNHYSMGLDVGNGAWSHPHYRDVIIGYHTGIRIGANYSGIRFYNNSPTTDANNDGNGDGGEALLMTIGGYVGTANHTDVVVNNNLFANVSMRAPIFYDSNDTAFYVDPNSSSRLRNLYVGDSGSNWSDPGGWGTQFHVSNGPHSIIRVYARNEGIETGMFSHVGGQSKVGSFTNHDFTIVRNFSDRMIFYSGYTYANGYFQAADSLRAPIFYDSNDTGYYLDPNGSSNLLTVTINNTYVGNAIYFGGGNNYFNWTNSRIYSNVGIESASAIYSPQFRLTNSTNNAYITGSSDWGMRMANDNGYIQFGPANNSWAHIYSGLPFYFNQELYVNGTQVVKNSGTWGINISGSSSQSNSLAITGYGSGNMTYYQSPGTFAGYSGWAGYFVSNHGDGATYYNQTIIMPFWGAPQYSRLQGGGAIVGPYTFWTTENLNDYAPNMNQYVRTSDNVTFNTTTAPTILVNNHSDNTKGYRIHNTSGSSVSAMFTNSSNQLVIAAGALDQINLNKKVYVNGVALGVNVTPSATAGRIDASNDIVAYSSSDERLKHNITPIENAIDKVKSLTGVEFDWKPEYKHAHGYEGHDTGIIAQQVQEVIPSAVRTNDTGFLAVRYEKLIGLLVEGMKEQQVQIEELKAKLDGLTK